MPKNNTGFIEPQIDETHYLLGSSPLPQAVLREDGDWSSYAPKFEPQRKTFETSNCSGFNTLDPIQRLLQRLGVNENYSDRWVGIIAGTKYPKGNDPHIVAEAIRKNGLIPESMLPFSDDLKDVNEYYSFKGANEAECRAEGQRWLQRFNFGHEWVFQAIDTNKQDKMMEALHYSPLGTSVDAWNFDSEKGLYVKPIGFKDNHWTVCVVGHVKDKYWLIDDSYLQDGTNLKKLAWDYDFNFCKRYHIELKPEAKKNLIVNIIEQLINLYQTAINYLKNSNNMPEPQPIPQPEPIPDAPQAPTSPVTPPKYDWSTPEAVRHSLRIICDEEHLTVEQKNTLCATVACESGFNTKAINYNKVNGKVISTDRGLCQWNDFYHGKEITADEALNNPEKAVRLMCQYWKHGQRNLWICYKKGGYKKYL